MKEIKINLGELYDPAQITRMLRELGIRTYAYSFIDNFGRVIKFGVQYSAGQNHGERVYRQAANLDGWGKPLPRSSSGMPMREIAKDYTKQYGIPLDRTNVSILIWDQTDLSLSLSEMRARCERIESQMIENHIELFGYAPVGNNEKTTKLKVMQKQNSAIINDLFE